MNKIAMYEAILENHPLWNKEAEVDPYTAKRRNAAIAGPLPGLMALKTAAAGLLAPEGRRGLAMAGQAVGTLGGITLGHIAGRGSVPVALVGGSLGGGLGTYFAQGDEGKR